MENPAEHLGADIARGSEFLITKQRLLNETKATSAEVERKNAETGLIQQQTANARTAGEISAAEAGRQPDIARELTARIDNVLKDTEWKTAQITTSGFQAEELKQRARREEQLADALKAVVPFITKGGKDLKGFIDWAESGAIGDWAHGQVEDFKKTLHDMATFRGWRLEASRVWDAFKKWAGEHQKRAYERGPIEVEARDRRNQEKARDEMIEEGRGYSLPLMKGH